MSKQLLERADLSAWVERNWNNNKKVKATQPTKLTNPTKPSGTSKNKNNNKKNTNVKTKSIT